MIRRRWTVVGASLLVVASGCTSDEPLSLPDPTAGAVETSSTAPPESPHVSDASIDIDGVDWTFSVSCTQLVEGEVLVWGEGVDPDTGLPAELLLQASASRPYIGITASRRLIEAAVDTPLVLIADAGVIRGDDISFVADADIDTGVGDPLGEGSVEVHCTRYVTPDE